MFDAIFSLLPTPLSLLLFAGRAPTRNGNRHLISTPFGSFRAQDGHVIIAVANDVLFHRLLRAIGREDLEADARFASDEARTENEPALREIIEAWTGARTVEAVVAELDEAGVPASPIWTLEQAAESLHVAHRRLLVPMHHPTAGEVSALEQPVHFSAMQRGRVGHAPLLGEHTEEVLRDVISLPATEARALAAATGRAGASRP